MSHEVSEIIKSLILVLGGVFASSGLWAFIMKRDQNNSALSQMVVGLAHDRIVFLGLLYIDRGYITHDEYENLQVYLFVPYEGLGGNGSAERIMKDVNNLPIRKSTHVHKGDNV